MTEPLFSVIVPTYGRPAFLREAVDSVLAQTVADLECIVVDDASPEPVTVDVDDERVRVVRRATNGGPSAARNTGVAHARGTYFTFLDDDDVYTPERLAIALAGFERAPLTVCFTRFDGGDGPGGGRILEGDVADVIRDGITPHPGATAIRRDAWLPLDETLAASADVEWWLRLAANAPVSTEPRLGCVLRRHGGTRHGNTARARLECMQRIRTMHADYFASHPRADAFQLLRIGLHAMAVDERGEARRAFRASLRRRPSARAAYHLLRAYGPR